MEAPASRRICRRSCSWPTRSATASTSWRAAEAVNKRQKRVLPSKIKAHFGEDLRGKVVGVWGLAFKPETDDIRESPALVLIDELLAAGATVKAHDPEAMPNIRAIYGDKVTLTDGAL
jgi:UDPglucose 6-dehydrogenase